MSLAVIRDEWTIEQKLRWVALLNAEPGAGPSARSSQRFLSVKDWQRIASSPGAAPPDAKILAVHEWGGTETGPSLSQLADVLHVTPKSFRKDLNPFVTGKLSMPEIHRADEKDSSARLLFGEDLKSFTRKMRLREGLSEFGRAREIAHRLTQWLFRSADEIRRNAKPGRRAIASKYGIQLDDLWRCRVCGKFFIARPHPRACPGSCATCAARASSKASMRRKRSAERANRLVRAQAAIKRLGRMSDWKARVARTARVTPSWITYAIRSGDMASPKISFDKPTGYRLASLAVKMLSTDDVAKAVGVHSITLEKWLTKKKINQPTSDRRPHRSPVESHRREAHSEVQAGKFPERPRPQTEAENVEN
jgi:hypothetical protein